MVLGGCEMTLKEAIGLIIGADQVQDFPVMASEDVETLINKIYNNHKGQLKAEQKNS
jgi:hypothetical protein